MLDFFRKYKIYVSKVLFTAWALSLMPGLFAAAEYDIQSAQDLGVFEKISRLYMPSLIGLEKEEALKENKVMASNSIPMNVGSVESLNLAYQIYSTPFLKDFWGEFKKNQLLDDCIFSDLEIYAGREGSDGSLFSKIDFTVTPFGKARLQSLFMQRYDDLSENVSRVSDLQRKVKVLVENEELFNNVDARLTELKDVFGDLLWMWKPLNDASMNFIDQAYFPKMDINLGEKKYELDMRKWNKDSFMLSSYYAFFTWGTLFGLTAYYIYRMFRDDESEQATAHKNAALQWLLYEHALGLVKGGQVSGSNLLEIYGLSSTQIEEFRKTNLLSGGENLTASLFGTGLYTINAGKGFVYSAWHGGLYAKEKISEFSAKYGIYTLIAIGALIMHIYSSYRSDTYFKNVLTCIRQKMKQVSLFYGNMASFEKTLKGIGVFADLLNLYDQNKRRFVSEKEHIAFDALFNDLITSSEYKTPSFFMGKGKILADFKKFLDLKSCLISSLLLVGEIDMLMSIAKLYKAHAKYPAAKYCFAEFVKADLPYVNIQGFWHPSINPDEAKVNSLELGTPAAGRGVILTGPNAAGKSSTLKGIIISIILSQTLGIAPASSIQLTPFARITSHLNVSDAQGRESLFQSEMNRALNFLGDVKKLGKGEFMFTILDELFSSTNPEEGMSGAYGIVKSLSDHPQCMSILATHFKKLTELEAQTNGYFKNYKVYVEVFKDGSFRRPFKFVPGISDQSMALLLMKKHGFEERVVRDAFDVLVQVKGDSRNIILPNGFVDKK